MVIRVLLDTSSRYFVTAGRVDWVKNSDEKDESIHRILLENVLGKLSLGRPRLERKDNKKLNSREIGCDNGRCKETSQDHVQLRVSRLRVMRLRFPLREVMAVSFIFLPFVLISVIDLAELR